MSKAESIAKYHDEHAGYGGVSREFHMRAATTLRDQEAGIAALRQRAEQAEAEIARIAGLPEADWAQVSAAIAQGLALHARKDQPEAKRLLAVLDDGKTYVGRILARATQAERELRDARSDKRDMGKIISDTMDALGGHPEDDMVGLARAMRGDLERAEADNAALLQHVNNAGHLMGLGQFDGANDVLCRAASGAHPGAALLERMRALEAVRDGVVAALGQDRVDAEAAESLASLVRSADALKVTP